MKNWVVLFLGLVPIYQEIRFDKWRWKDGKDDKPLSTWIRGILIIALALFTGWFLDGPYWLVVATSALYYFSTHYLLFNPWLNVSRRPKKSLGYRKEGEWWYDKPYVMEYTAKIWLWYVSWLLLFHWEIVQGEYISTGTWWEKVSQFITF